VACARSPFEIFTFAPRRSDMPPAETIHFLRMLRICPPRQRELVAHRGPDMMLFLSSPRWSCRRSWVVASPAASTRAGSTGGYIPADSTGNLRENHRAADENRRHQRGGINIILLDSAPETGRHLRMPHQEESCVIRPPRRAPSGNSTG
jgi:hypothetical protein